jgi:serine/threonine-protein kinase
MDQDALIGTLFSDRFRIESLLGSGGMASVYLAQDEEHGQVALKLLHRRLLADVEIMGRFRREARAISLIEHPNIARVLDFGHSDLGVPYLAMEYARGPDLGRVLTDERLTLDRALSVLSQVAGALAAAHQAGVIHRDLKPSNVVLIPEGDGQKDLVKVLDFGMAKILKADETTSLSIPGATYGTPEYMSPEQISGEPLDHRTDVYSFGILAFELVVGRPPFVGSMVDVMDAHLTREPEAPSRASDGAVPSGLDALVNRCLEKGPDSRFQDAGALVEALTRLG